MDGTAEGSSDTSPEVEELMFRLWRQASIPRGTMIRAFGWDPICTGADVLITELGLAADVTRHLHDRRCAGSLEVQ
jgi:hypothetical protein